MNAGLESKQSFGPVPVVPRLDPARERALHSKASSPDAPGRPLFLSFPGLSRWTRQGFTGGGIFPSVRRPPSPSCSQPHGRQGRKEGNEPAT